MTFAERYEAIAPKLTNWLVANGCSHATACDVVQETFLRVWKRRDELVDDDAMVSGLVWTTARNVRLDLVRKQKREVLQEEIKDEDAGSVRPALARADAEYLRARIRRAVNELPPLLREAYTLFQIGELSIREIMQRTDASESTVKVRIFRAKEQLRKKLKDLVGPSAAT